MAGIDPASAFAVSSYLYIACFMGMVIMVRRHVVGGSGACHMNHLQLVSPPAHTCFHPINQLIFWFKRRRKRRQVLAMLSFVTASITLRIVWLYMKVFAMQQHTHTRLGHPRLNLTCTTPPDGFGLASGRTLGESSLLLALLYWVFHLRPHLGCCRKQLSRRCATLLLPCGSRRQCHTVSTKRHWCAPTCLPSPSHWGPPGPATVQYWVLV